MGLGLEFYFFYGTEVSFVFGFFLGVGLEGEFFMLKTLFPVC